MEHEEIGHDGAEWIHHSQDMVQWHAHANMVINLLFLRVYKCLTILELHTFSTDGDMYKPIWKMYTYVHIYILVSAYESTRHHNPEEQHRQTVHMTKIYKTIILPLVLYECEGWIKIESIWKQNAKENILHQRVIVFF
jgi:hypothetical protein